MSDLFEKFISRLLVEQDPTGVDPRSIGDGDVNTGGPTPFDMGPSPSQEPQPEPEAKEWDKPMKELAKILYKAIETNFDELPEDLTNKLYTEFPNGVKSIGSDEEGSALFGIVEDILKSPIDDPSDVTPYEQR